MGLAHGNDISLKRALHNIPLTLINHKRCLAVITSVLVCLRYHPCRGIRNTLEVERFGEIRNIEDIFDAYQIEHFSLLNEYVEAIHHFLDRSLPVPPVDVENINVCRSQFLQAGFHANMHRFDIVSCIEDLLLDPGLTTHKICCVLCT